MIKTIIPFLFSILFISCTFNGEHQSLNSSNTKQVSAEPILFDLSFKCEEIKYVSDEESYTVVFKVAYANKSDYTLFLDDTPRLNNSIDADETSTGFVIENKSKGIAIQLNNMFIEEYSIIKADTSKFIYLYLYNRPDFGIITEADKINWKISYKGGDLKKKKCEKHFTGKDILMNRGEINVSLENAKNKIEN